MTDFLHFILLYGIVVLLIASFLCILISRKAFLSKRSVHYLLLLPVGVGHIIATIRNFIFSEHLDILIGLDLSRFQFKVGLADLGLGIAAILAFRKSFSFCLGVSLFYIVFASGLAVEYIKEILSGIAPVQVYWTVSAKSIQIPLLMLSLIGWYRREKEIL